MGRRPRPSAFSRLRSVLLKGLKLLVGSVGLVGEVLRVVAQDGAAPNPYGAIARRNVFRLVAPPPASAPLSEADTAALAIRLTGFAKIPGEPGFAFFICARPTGTVSVSLREGERQGSLELIQLRVADKAADILNGGTRLTLWLKDNKPGAVPVGFYGGNGRPLRPLPGFMPATPP